MNYYVTSGLTLRYDLANLFLLFENEVVLSPALCKT
jgi:hypothetical protein